jgi:MFS family permease
VPVVVQGSYPALIVAAFLIGGSANPLYALLLAYTNDFLEVEDMPAASAGLMFVNGIGAVAGPLVTGWAMTTFGPTGFFVYIAVMMLVLVGYGLWRSTRRAAPSVDETQPYAPVLPSASPVAMDMAQEIYAEAVEDAAEEGGEATDARPFAQ